MGNRFARIGDDINNIDAEGVLVDMTVDSSDEPITVKKKITPLAAVQEGFTRLTEVIREMNENVSQHREQAADLNRKITSMLEALPENMALQNESVTQLSGHIKEQTDLQQECNNILRSLPEDSRRQVENLSRISASLENSLQHQSDQAELFSQFSNSVKSVSEYSQAQAASLANIGNMLEENQKRLQDMIDTQNKRFGKLFITTVILALAALAAVAMALWLALGKGQTPLS